MLFEKKIRTIRVLDEVTTIQESKTEEGDRLYEERHTIDVAEESGLRDAIIALLSLSTAGLIIYVTWAIALSMFGTPSLPSSPHQTTSVINFNRDGK